MPYRAGDEVLIRVSVPYTNDRRNVKLQVIALRDVSYGTLALLYVPHYENVPETRALEPKHRKLYDFRDKFLGEQALEIDTDDVIEHYPGPHGTDCARCGVFMEGMAPGSKCRACTENPYR